MKFAPLLSLLLVGSVWSLAACQSLPGSAPAAPYTPDITVTRAPYTEVHANWKQRLDQPYVYFEHVGDYRLAGKRFPELHEAMQSQGIRASGPPFLLFYDDPAQVAIDELRARICLPVASAVNASGDVRYGVLPSTTVVYAVVEGPYPDVPQAYPGLYEYLAKMHWVENGPIREIYLVLPGEAEGFERLLCEVQIPATQAR